MIKKFQIFENTLLSLNNIKNLKENEKSLIDLIGFDNNKYMLTTYSNYNDLDFTLSFNNTYLKNELGISIDLVSIVTLISSHYEYFVSSDDIYFIDDYFSYENEITIKKLSKILDIDYNNLVENQNMGEIFYCLSPFVDIYDIMYYIGEANKNVIQKHVKKLIKNLPFNISLSYVSDFEIDLDFNIETICEFIQKNNLKDIDTIYDFLQKVDLSDFNENIENIYEIRESENVNYSSVQKEIQKQLEFLIDTFDNKSKNISIYNDPNQLSIFKSNEIQKNKKYKFDYDVYSKLKLEDINHAKKVGGKILAWFKSYQFQKTYMDDNEPTLEKYKKLIKLEIINKKIQIDYEYLESSEIYNL